jgi:hypothetical protein
MKTPREILLERHRAVGPKLDAIRSAVVAGLNHEATKEQTGTNFMAVWLLGCAERLWQELFLPSRRVWSGLAAAWVSIVVVNFAERDPAPSGKAAAAPVMMNLADQQRLLNELFADRTPAADADREKTFSPKPRTEKFYTSAV